MASVNKGFAAFHRAFERKLERMLPAIGREAVQDLGHEANRPIAQGGRMPVDTGFLRNSFVASTAGVPTSTSGPFELVVATWSGEDTLWMGWTAKYAMRQEYGFHGPDALGRVYSQAGNAFRRTAQQRWPVMVVKAAHRVEQSALGRPL